MTQEQTTLRPIASYEAAPGEVGRVLLLYSGGLDTSVMLKWIQDEYEAEVVALTVNLGQPGEDFDVVRGKALKLGALDCHLVDAREQFAEEYVLPAIKANALYGGGYPLFTALGRPLIARLAVEKARETGCDTIAHGCTGKGNDQVRIESTVLALAPELKIIAPVRGWQMGREEEIAYAREHGIPVKGGTEAPPYSIDDNLWGRSSEGGAIEDLDEPPRDDVFQLVTAPENAPDEAQDVVVEFERGRPVALDGERLGLVDLLERAAELGRPARRGDRGPRGGPDRGPEGARPVRGARGGDHPARPPRARAPGEHHPPEQLQAAARQPVGVPRLRGAVARAAPGGPERLHGVRERAGDGRDHDEALQGVGAPGGAALPQCALRPGAGRLRRVGRAVLAAVEPGVHRALEPSVAHGLRNQEPGRGEGMSSRGYTVLGWAVWQLIRMVAKQKVAENRVKIGAAATVGLVLLGGILAARASSEE